MNNLLILGGGTAGAMMANKLRKALDRKDWKITIVDKDKTHYYQPGFLFIPFGIYKEQDVIKPKAKFFPTGVEVIFANTEKINADGNSVTLEGGRILSYDYLIIATGTEIRPDQTPGMKDKLWYKNIFDFYTLEGALALEQVLKTWQGGKLVVAITDLPIKCPVAPLEFVFLAEAFFTKKSMRNKVDITFVTPLSGAFTKPIATQMLSKLLTTKNIKVVTDFYIERIDNEKKKLISYDEKEIAFDLLAIVPLNMGDKVIARSGLGDDMNYVPTDKYTLQSKAHNNIFVIGDATDLPTSKAGSVAHFAGDILFENILNTIKGNSLIASFDGHANCFIETGYGKGTLIDFNYDTEPLPGAYPVPIIGPFMLLKNNRLNHYGKLIFKWIYWYFLPTGRKLPVKSEMTMSGKRKPK
ncbi:MAG: FAD/NAD(P)-binding oxidoreductase [Bacteroidales bacterium]|nr:FAD/NAD(P)-binding oxidoreductase [Bacteroidales bacterium]MDZ4204573.1 FAD/NAD(P)-binding oxidoreductase [Bacteroidales bacterium]